SELYSSLWSSCDELRGGMDASQYKDYVLVMLFIKYVSDKYAGQPFAPIIIPPLANANKLSSMPNFNDPEKLGSGKNMVDGLSNLIAIFENKALDFSKNRTHTKSGTVRPGVLCQRPRL
ncbi:type I restriction-modification system subunit M N-terminal domain-containing protein, partial [Nitrosomonas communis]|uniref:type I restriction-modification system subunit M N-terminal domain-containing protein n=1 Tax=Nitrosomonas communis TaxID=44574 RepID=UPI0026F24041